MEQNPSSCPIGIWNYHLAPSRSKSRILLCPHASPLCGFFKGDHNDDFFFFISKTEFWDHWLMPPLKNLLGGMIYLIWTALQNLVAKSKINRWNKTYNIWLRPKFKFPAKIEMVFFSQILAIRCWLITNSSCF